jgi:hypothetical protein
MWQRSQIPYIFTISITVLGSFASGEAPAADPVEQLREALMVRPDDRSKLTKEFLAHRDKLLEERVGALRTIAELRRALVEWKIDPERAGTLQKLDEKWRAVVGNRLKKALAAAAKSPEENVRLAVANLIAEMGPTVPALEATDPSGFARGLSGIVVGLVRDPKLSVRQEALRALATINADPDQAVPVFGDMLKSSKEVDVRRLAADGLRRLVRVVTNLNKKLQMKSAEVWSTPEELIKTCKDVVQKIADISKDHSGIRDGDTEVRIICLEAIAEAGAAFSDLPGAYKKEDFPLPGRKPTADELNEIARQYKRVQDELDNLQPLLQAMAAPGEVLREAAASRNPRIKLAAATTLEELSHIRLRLRQRAESLPKLDNTPRPALPKAFDAMIRDGRSVMARLLEEPANALDIRRQAAEFLENIGDDAVPSIPALTKALADPNRFIRWGAARTLGRLPVEKAASAVADLAALLDDNDIDVRQAATRTLEHMGPRARPALDQVKAKILDKRGDPEFRIGVMYVLVSIGTHETVSAIPPLISALSDSEPRVRRTAAEVLGKYGRHAESAVPALRQALADEDADVRQRASDALLSILVAPAPEEG